MSKDVKSDVRITNAAAPPTPPSRPAAAPPKKSRRKFISLIAVVGGLLTLAPYVPFGTFLSSSVGGSSATTKPQTIVLDNNTSENGNAAGKKVNVNDLTSFPPNNHWVMTYPSSGDPNLDGQNPNTFVKFDLIRLPTELGGDKKTASDFVAFSKVCVHLWCSPNYGGGQNNPSPTHRDYECPCHGSLYSIGEQVTINGKTITPPVGVAFEGPAAVQPPPTNAIPMLTLTTDGAGNLQVVPPIWDVDHNGVLGYGRAVGAGTGTGYSPE
ncbi:MAG: Rieske 2Fe-2S domain-containing protein [Thaumarchaeota archaeon]|nr:Rieske 2Fe-2S domain-containing protein [Nitrososphaerota archaeon]